MKQFAQGKVTVVCATAIISLVVVVLGVGLCLDKLGDAVAEKIVMAILVVLTGGGMLGLHRQGTRIEKRVNGGGK